MEQNEDLSTYSSRHDRQEDTSRFSSHHDSSEDTSSSGSRHGGQENIASSSSLEEPLAPLPVFTLQKSTGWRKGVFITTYTTCTVLIINLTLTVSAIARYGVSGDGGIGTAFDGDCSTASTYGTVLHILINVTSSILLAASNYCMQCLAAPTRAECDAAHSRSDWLDIGVLSVRNIFKLKWTRIVLWSVLMMSSIPIHLVYNSAVFKTLSSNSYQAIFVDEQFLSGTPVRFAYITTLQDFIPQRFLAMQQDYRVNTTNYANLTADQCIKSYSNDFIRSYNDLLMVLARNSNDASNGTDGLVFDDIETIDKSEATLPTGWLCTAVGGPCIKTCNVANLPQELNETTFFGRKFEYCMAQRTDQHCKLQFSTTMLSIVIVCNLLKAAVMVTMLVHLRTPSLVVLGDAIASYLDEPDDSSKNACCMVKRDVGIMTRLKRIDEIHYAQHLERTRWTAESKPHRWRPRATALLLYHARSPTYIVISTQHYFGIRFEVLIIT